MTFRVLHTSDWHLGQNFYGKSRAAEHQAFIAWLLTQVSHQGIDAIIIAGDIFDTGTPPSYAREIYFDFIVKLHALACPLIVLAGNHDSVTMLGESQSLLAKLGCQVITKASDLADNEHQIIHLTNASGEHLTVCGIPFIRARDLVTSVSGQSIADKQQQLQQAIATHYQALVEQAKQQSPKGSAIVATGHLTTVGASTSDSVREIYIGTLEAFPASCFPEVDYIALGHIHKAQKVAKTEHIRYCGSPISLSFDECNQQKVVNIVEFTQGQLGKVKELAIPCFQPMAMVKTNLDRLNEQIESVVTEFTDDLSAGQNIWLDIELASSDYLNDLTQRVQDIVTHFPVEVLLVRRAKQTKQNHMFEQDNITLAELSLQQVFDTRLGQENWQGEQALARKQRLTTLFKQISAQAMEPEQANEQADSERSNTEPANTEPANSQHEQVSQ